MSRMRNRGKLEERRKHVKAVVLKSQSTEEAVKKLAKQLFVSESTIYKDLAK